MSRIEPNQSQKRLLEELNKFHKNKNKPIYVYSGPPGSGKTWVIALFFENNNIRPNEYITCAFSGKAANVLARRGLPAKTIHSLIYNRVMVPFEAENGEIRYKPEFVLKSGLQKGLKYIVVDEMSMVPDSIMSDLLSFGIPVIGMGDINQLPPVFGESSYMLRPDFCLNEIMRQEKDSPIIKLSQMALHGEHIHYGDYGQNCRVLRNIQLGENLIDDYDIILCNRNKTRDILNDIIRHDIYGIQEQKPVIGDKVMCKQNNWDMCVEDAYLTNGTVGFITYIDEQTETSKKFRGDFTAEFSDTATFINVEFDLKYITSPYYERQKYGITSYTKFEYANAITVHSSQGSQYDRVLYIDDGFGGSTDLLTKLKYTAITRAAKSIDIVNGFNLFN